MVAISLYRGNLHRGPDIPRRWVMPRRGISLKDFRGLLRRRSKALSLLKADHGLASTSAPSAIGTGRNPPLPPRSLPPLPPPLPLQKRPDEQIEEEDVKPQARNSSSPVPVEVRSSERNANLEDRRVEDVAVVAVEELAHLASSVGGKVKVVEKVSSAEDLQVETDKGKGEEQEKKNEDPNSEGNHKLGATNEKEERKREVEEKLEILNKKKHNLVQALKQVSTGSNLNSAEEELKRRSNMQPTRSSVPLQVDVSNDSGSMTRVTTPRTGSEANVGGNTGGGEADDVLNHDLQSRHVPCMSSISSPCAESALKRSSYFQHNAVSNPSRSSALVSGIPLHFAILGNQVQASNLPLLSTSGTNYIVSSSSPAASVGTSSFKDARSASS